MTESTLKTSWLNGDVAKTTIIGLMKKTGASQLKIGETILGVKNEMKTLIDAHLDTKQNPKKDFEKAIKDEYNAFLESLPFGSKVADKFASFASDPMIVKYIDVAPIAYNTLSDKLKKVNEDTWKFMIDNGLNPYSTAKQVSAWKTEYQLLTAEPDVPETTEDEVNEAIDDAKSIANEDKTSTDTSDFKVEEETTEEVTEETTCNTCGEVECVCDEDEFENGINDYNNAKSNSISCIETIAYINASPNVSEDMLKQLNVLLEEVIAEFVNEEGLDTDDLMLSMNPAVLIDNPNYDVKFDVAA